MTEQEVKCEDVYKDTQCDRSAKVRAIKRELFRTFNRNYVSGDVDKYYREIIHEKFLCVSCAERMKDYKIVEWIVPKIPHEVLFGINTRMKYMREHNLKYWQISEEKTLRWKEQVFCPNCGQHGLSHEVRYYTDNDGYDSPNRWVNAYKIVHCKNCGFFDFLFREKRLGYDWKKDEAGEYHGYKKPDNDPDYKKWREIEKKIKELKEEEE